MPIEINPLPYDYAALEPHIDEATMRVHHDKHYATYVSKYNDAIAESGQEFDNRPLHEVLANECANVPEKIRKVVRNNGGGAFNHALFWEILGPAKTGGGKPNGNLAKAIDAAFGSFEDFKAKFKAAGIGRFGSGWVWLVKEGQTLKITDTANQDSPVMFGQFPVIGLDVWEHAYYLKYQNKRPDYIDAFWNVVNWDAAENRFNRAK